MLFSSILTIYPRKMAMKSKMDCALRTQLDSRTQHLEHMVVEEVVGTEKVTRI